MGKIKERDLPQSPPPQKSNDPSLRYLLQNSEMSFVPERNELISYRVYIQGNLACKNKYLCHFLSFSMLPSLLKRIHTDKIVVPRLHYSGTKGRPEWVFCLGMKTPINSFRNDSFRINLTLESCGNRYELVLEQNSFRYHSVKGPWKFLFPKHHALHSCQNTVNFNSVEATTCF